MTYTASGRVRGSCGHKHRSVETAYRCAQRDNRSCKKAGGDSDRHVKRSDGTQLSCDEQEKLFMIEYSKGG